MILKKSVRQPSAFTWSGAVVPREELTVVYPPTIRKTRSFLNQIEITPTKTMPMLLTLQICNADSALSAM
jgi:uncharacterized protein involved in tolerance to divalent cations